MDLSDPISSLNINHQAPTNIQTFAAILNNTHTEFTILYFQNNVTYIISQFGKIGNFYLIETEQVDNGIVDTEPVYNLRTLLGSDNIEIEAGVRFIAQKLKLKKPLIISLTLKEYSVQTIKLILEAITNYQPK